MITAPDAVYVIIPCITELGMSWAEVKNTPRRELVGLLAAFSNYNIIHAFDGYSPDEIGDMSKNKPQIRSDYNKSISLKRDYESRSGMQQKKIQSFKDIM